MKILFALPVLALMLFGCKKAQTQSGDKEEEVNKVATPAIGKAPPATTEEETPKTNSPLRPVSKRKSSDTGKSTTTAGEANKTTELPTLPALPTPVEGSGSLVGSWQVKVDDKFSCTLTFAATGKGKIRLEEAAEVLDMDITWTAKEGHLTLTKKDPKKVGAPDVSEGNYSISGDELELNFADEKHVLTRKP